MSVTAMAWAWRQRVSSTEKLILLALADHADDAGFCWPGQAGVGEKCGLARETVNRSLKRLEEAGLATGELRCDSAGRTLGKSYRLKVGGPVTDGHRVCDAGSQVGVTEAHTESSSEETSREPSEEDHAPSASRASEPVPAQWPDDGFYLRDFIRQEQTLYPAVMLDDPSWWLEVHQACNGLPLPWLRVEFAKMGVWLMNNPGHRKRTQRGIRRFVSGWLIRGYERKGRESNGQVFHQQFRH
jgi:helix-turn-helix protein